MLEMIRIETFRCARFAMSVTRIHHVDETFLEHRSLGDDVVLGPVYALPQHWPWCCVHGTVRAAISGMSHSTLPGFGG
jgi:hypothetical protein